MRVLDYQKDSQREEILQPARLAEFDAPPGSGLFAVDWAPDGGSLTFSVDQKGASNVWTQPLAGGPPKQLTDFEIGAIYDLAWSSDGKHLAFVRGARTNDAVLITDFRPSTR